MRISLTLSVRIFILASIFSFQACSEEDSPSAPAIESIEPSAGSAGKQVTITGSGFSTSKQSNKVKFNGTSAVVVSATSNELVVTAPSSTTGEITIETANGKANGPVFTYQSTTKSITSFLVNGYSAIVNSVTNTISISVPALTDVTELTPVVAVSELATLSPASGIPQDFTSPVQYTVTAEDNSTRVYNVHIQWVYGITSLTLNSGSTLFAVTIDNQNFLAKADVSFFNIRNREVTGTPLTFTATVQPDFLLTPASGGSIDLDDPDQLLVKAPNEVVQTFSWQIRNKDAHLTGFALHPDGYGFQAHQAYPEEAAGLDNTDIVIRILTTENYVNVVPAQIHFAERASISPLATAAQDFTNDVTYQVTSETGVTNSTTIRVLREKILFTNDYKGSITNIPANGNPFWTVYRSVSEVTGAKLIHTSNGSEIPCTVSVLVSEGKNYLYVYPTAAFPAGDYRLQVQLADGSIVLVRYINRAA